MAKLALDYGSQLIKYRFNGKEYVSGNTAESLEDYIEWLVDNYGLCEKDRLDIILGVDSKKYLEMKSKIVRIDKQGSNGKRYNYKIQLFPSLSAIAVENLSRLGDMCGILDIGYTSSRYAMFKDGKINRSSVVSIPLGIDVLYKSVKNTLKEIYDIKSTEVGVYRILMNGSDNETAQVFSEYKHEYLELLKSEITRLNPAFSMVDNYVFGGNSDVLREQVGNESNLYYVSNTTFDVVRGLEKMIELM